MPADDDRNEVLTSLPRSRPQRRSSKRATAAAKPAGETEPRVAKVAATAARESAAAGPRRPRWICGRT